MTSKDPEASRASAEVRLRRKEESEAAAKLVRAEVEARKVAEQAKTVRLRALRLEKEAAEAAQVVDARAGGGTKVVKRK